MISGVSVMIGRSSRQQDGSRRSRLLSRHVPAEGRRVSIGLQSVSRFDSPASVLVGSFSRRNQRRNLATRLLIAAPRSSFKDRGFK